MKTKYTLLFLSLFFFSKMFAQDWSHFNLIVTSEIIDGMRWSMIKSADGKIILPNQPLRIESYLYEGYAVITSSETKLSGIIDSTGKIIVEPSYSLINLPFVDGTVEVILNNYRNLINKQGKLLLNEYQPSSLYFISNNAEVVYNKNKMGVIKRDGLQIIPYIYDSITIDFLPNEEIYYKCKIDDKVALVSAAGIEIFPPLYNDAELLYSQEKNYIIVKNRKSGLYSIKEKKLVIQCIYNEINVIDSHEGAIEKLFAEVADSSDKNGIFSITDKKIIIPCKYTGIEPFLMDLYSMNDDYLKLFCGFKTENKKEKDNINDYYSPSGKLLISTSDDIELSYINNTDTIIGMFYKHNNYGIKNGYFVYNRKTGNLLKYRECNIVETNSNGFIVSEGNKFGVINPVSSTYIIKPQYDTIRYDFQYVAEKNNITYILDSDGKILIPNSEYDKINDYLKGYSYDNPNAFMVSKNGKWGTINTSLEKVIDLKYDTLIANKIGEANYYVAKMNNKWSYIDTAGIAILPFEYDRELILDYNFWASKNGKWGYIYYKNGNAGIDFKYDTSLYKPLIKTNIIADSPERKTKAGSGTAQTIKPGQTKVISLLFKDMYEVDARNGKLLTGPKSFAASILSNDSIAFQYYLPISNENEKETALCASIYYSRLSSFKTILQAKPNLLFTDGNTKAPIAEVVDMHLNYFRKKRIQTDTMLVMLNLLISAGANPNQRDFIGNTPLMTYLNENLNPDTRIVDALLKAGCKVNAKGWNNKDVFDYTENCSSEIKKLLVDYKKQEK